MESSCFERDHSTRPHPQSSLAAYCVFGTEPASMCLNWHIIWRYSWNIKTHKNTFLQPSPLFWPIQSSFVIKILVESAEPYSRTARAKVCCNCLLLRAKMIHELRLELWLFSTKKKKNENKPKSCFTLSFSSTQAKWLRDENCKIQ